MENKTKSSAKDQLIIGVCMLLLAIGVICGFINYVHSKNIEANRPAVTALALSEDYKKLTQYHNYFDVVKVMGKPDGEVSNHAAPIPNVIMVYKSCNCAVIVRYRTNDGDKEKTAYIGTKGLNPEQVLDVAKEDYRELISALKLTK